MPNDFNQIINPCILSFNDTIVLLGVVPHEVENLHTNEFDGGEV